MDEGNNTKKRNEESEGKTDDTDQERDSSKKIDQAKTDDVDTQTPDNKEANRRPITTWILAITMIGILWQAFEMNRSVRKQANFNDSGLRPYLAVDPSFKAPYIQDSLIVVTSSFTNYGRTPAYNTVLTGRPSSTEIYPDSLLRALIEQDEDSTMAIAYPSQPGITFTGESVVRNPYNRTALSGVTLDSLIASTGPLFYHVYVEYESAWEETYYLRCSFKYVGGTMWSTIFASEAPSYDVARRD